MSLEDGFREMDKYNKGYLSVYDLEDIISEVKRSKQSPEVVKDVECLLAKYDRRGERRISIQDFIEELTPK